MQLGVILPQTEIGNDPAVIRAYAAAVETAGYAHLAVYDHVLGADPDRAAALGGPYTYRTPFHEVFVLLAHLAAVTERIELVTEVLVLPQRQTALVAKQAAEIDLLAGSRLRLGVGIGWNAVEFEALGEDFRTRGRRVEEQIEVLRLLWSQDLVTFHGRFHHFTGAGINPRPPRGSIPVWIGGSAEPAVRRAARLADGFMLNVPVTSAAEQIELVRGLLAEAGRDPAAFGIAGRVTLRDDPEETLARVRDWEQLGATHVSVNTMGTGLAPEEHAERLAGLARVWHGYQPAKV
ncbi:MAG TPA: LLM class F420-dependent oxidoreductase [Candidatus Dormibacteraeota bacterium]|jgi:probable F420-dependent oxidoreductase|nr:LLM class F420-dependent oxidoreductase [Candidatus Dormibacteraeota bacterium]